MSDTTPVQAAETPAADPSQMLDPTESTDPPTDERGGNREAARYRMRLREAETQRDALSGRLETMQRAEAQRLAERHLVDGADLWRGDGINLDTLLDDNGDVDPHAVAKHAKIVAAKHPHWKRTFGRRPSAGELRSGATSPDYHRPQTWADILNDRHGDA